MGSSLPPLLLRAALYGFLKKAWQNLFIVHGSRGFSGKKRKRVRPFRELRVQKPPVMVLGKPRAALLQTD